LLDVSHLAFAGIFMNSEDTDIVLEKLNLADLKRKSPKDLLSMAEELEIENASTMRRAR